MKGGDCNIDAQDPCLKTADERGPASELFGVVSGRLRCVGEPHRCGSQRGGKCNMLRVQMQEPIGADQTKLCQP